MPASFVDVAALILQLFVLYKVSSNPDCLRTSGKRYLKSCCARGTLPPLQINKGPGVAPRAAKYGNNALTGYSEESVLPRHKRTPWQNWSVLDCLMNSQTFDGERWLSKAASARDKWISESYWVKLGAASSLTQRKPKSAVQHAAQSIILLTVSCWCTS